jgi:C terminal of Calcineurin-like phosphoesterase/N terminal of Calcineurin-like phosphoesterase
MAMKRTICRMSSIVMLCGLWGFVPSARAADDKPAQTARGVVFVDQNNNQKLDSGERPLSGVRVSNGRQIVKTDERGRYELPVDDDEILFVIKPRGYRTPLSEDKLPRFYYIHKPHGSPASKFAGVAPTGPLPGSVDFPLYKQKEPEQFRAILFGDTQPRDQKEVDYIAHDVVEEVIGTDASFGVTLGDIVFDDLDVFEPLNKTIALIGIPWYNVIGNHDINYDAQDDHHSDETFERIYGPAYYSFDYGQVHFIVLDDVEWFIPSEGGKGEYRGGLGEEQMEFVKNDLALIPHEQLVVLLMHIPLVDVRDRHDLYRLIEKRPFCISISAHKHYHEHRYIKTEDGWLGKEPHHHIINVTVCGSWWSGAPDERGIPHTTMADGAPNGYSIISFDGTQYRLDFKAAGRSADYQMEIHAPEVVPLDKLGETTVYVNVFNGSERSKVELSLDDGDWMAMRQTREIDPQYAEVVKAEAAVLATAPKWRKLPDPKPSSHLWKAALSEGGSPGVHLLRVRATDDNGERHTAQRVIRFQGKAPNTN